MSGCGVCSWSHEYGLWNNTVKERWGRMAGRHMIAQIIWAMRQGVGEGATISRLAAGRRGRQARRPPYIALRLFLASWR